jgi:predicted DCC family thiol-disulfide oxidoreductase YuxK
VVVLPQFCPVAAIKILRAMVTPWRLVSGAWRLIVKDTNAMIIDK